MSTHAKERGFSLQQQFRWSAENPAKLAGVSDRKGKLARGYDADLVIWSDRESITVKAEELRHKHKLTPYAGRTLRGRVHTTYVRGQRAFPLSSPSGTLLRKT